MLLFPQIIAIVAMIVVTYVGLLAFGPARQGLLYTVAEKNQWDTLIRRSFGSWLTSTNIVGTLTSFATVVVFFLGNAPLFGWLLFVCSLTIWFGAYATNFFTRRICAVPRVAELLASPDQTGGVIASLAWSESKSARVSASILKWLSLFNISAVIWLEFALLTDIGGGLLGIPSATWRAGFFFLLSFVVFYFVLRFGIRGFVFSDIFQTPILLLSALALLIGATIVIAKSPLEPATLLRAATPLLDSSTLWMFALHVIVLNTFLVLVTEPHWLRVWIFREKETRLQARSTLATAGVWVVLILIGFGAGLVTDGAVGEAGIAGLVRATAQVSPIFLTAFWFAGVAALFTTSDANIYAFLIVRGFSANDGRLRQESLQRVKPAVMATASALLLACLYLLVRHLAIPLEKLIFLIIPLGLNGLPALVRVARGREAKASHLVLSLALYSACGVAGLLQPENELFWTLAAAAAPVLISLVVWFKR